jgi:Tol biopolymer transport system component
MADELGVMDPEVSETPVEPGAEGGQGMPTEGAEGTPAGSGQTPAEPQPPAKPKWEFKPSDFTWNAGGLVLCAGAVVQWFALEAFRRFWLSPAALLTAIGLILAEEGIRRGALRKQAWLAMLVFLATLLMASPFFAFFVKERKTPVQVARGFQMLARNMDYSLDDMQWTAGVLRPDMVVDTKWNDQVLPVGTRVKNSENPDELAAYERTYTKLSPRLSYGFGTKKKQQVGFFDPDLGGANDFPVGGEVSGTWWSPNAQYLAFTSGTEDDPDQDQISVLAVPDPMDKKLLAGEKLKIDKPRVLSRRDVWPDQQGQAWDKDSRRLLFASDRHGVSRLWQADLKRKTLTPLTEGEPSLYPAWSPAGGRFAFVIKKPKAYVKYREGMEAEKVFTLQWNNDRSQIVRTEEGELRKVRRLNKINPRRMSKKPEDYLWSLALAGVGGAGKHEIFKTDGAEILPPVWSPRGDLIAVAVRFGKKSNLLVMDPSGRKPMKVFITPREVTELRWNPAKPYDELAFAVGEAEGEGPEIWTVRADGLYLERVYQGEPKGSLRHLSWSSTGQFIAFEESVRRWMVGPDLRAARVVELRSKQARLLWPMRLETRSPSFSPNGTMVAFIGSQRRWLPGWTWKRAIWACRVDYEF